jgi:hypothetical protein
MKELLANVGEALGTEGGGQLPQQPLPSLQSPIPPGPGLATSPTLSPWPGTSLGPLHLPHAVCRVAGEGSATGMKFTVLGGSAFPCLPCWGCWKVMNKR